MKKKILSILTSMIIISVIYFNIDLKKINEVISGLDFVLFSFAISIMIPITYFISLRLKILNKDGTLSIFNSLQLTLAASTINLILPSKMGDVLKATFMKGDGFDSFSLVVLEKLLDLLSLLIWCTFGLCFIKFNRFSLILFFTIIVMMVLILLVIFSKSFCTKIYSFSTYIFKSDKSKIVVFLKNWLKTCVYINSNIWFYGKILIFSIFIWVLHLTQIWLLILSLNVSVPILSSFAFTSLSILIGLFPLSFAGIGTRDAALIFFYKSFMNIETGAALGILTFLRYLIPGLIGIPFITKFLKRINQ